MKKKTTALITSLLLIMLITAGSVLGEPLASNPEDLTEICSDRTLQAQEGDSFTFCKLDLGVTALDENTVKINDQNIGIGQTGKFDGLEISYDSFLDGEATISLSMKFEKKLESKFEENRFKLFYDDDAKFAGPADASREAIAEISYGTNKAKVSIRSATREQLMLGIDFENEDGTATEKLNIPILLKYASITSIDEPKILSNPDQPELFQWGLEQEKIKLTLGDAIYNIELDKTSLDNVPAIKISSDQQFMLPGNGASPSKQTKTLWISTKLAKSTPEELACSYDTTGSSIDDLTIKARVQGLYPSSPRFFDVFTDYCVDQNTLINYGCIGLRESGAANLAAIVASATWKLTSRVAFLEVTCSCSEGSCTTGPYCIDSDKHADHQENVKGTVKILKALEGETFTEANVNYVSGRSKFKDEVNEDTCVNSTTVKEYKCIPSEPGFLAEEIYCGAGNTCSVGKCITAQPQGGEIAPTPPPDSQLGAGEIPPVPITEDLGALRTELGNLEALIAALKAL